ncbi:MAG TPA: glycosyltransferase family 4 protein [Candidatus Binataceae bacterium]|nr:glycosyltransferase family 4 protein [Candidatus Binataceae bacterium]
MSVAVTILALVTDAFGGRGGIAQYNRDFLKVLAALDKVSSIHIVPRHAPDPADHPTNISQAPPLFARFLYSIRALATALASRPDVVFCGHLYMAPLAWIVARLIGAKLVIQTHGVEAWEHPPWLQRTALQAADTILCVSRYTRSRVLDWAAIAPERVVVLPNTVGDAYVVGDGRVLRDASSPDEKKSLLTVARMDGGQRYKGHDRVIDAIPRVVENGHDVGYLIVGEGDDRMRLEERARAKGIADRVHFTGPVAAEKLPDLFRTADLFVMPSTGEGFGIAFLEAMASGTPALGLAVGGACDALADGELGTAVAEDADLAEAISRLLSGPKPDAGLLSAQTRARFGPDVFRERVRLVLDRLLAPA